MGRTLEAEALFNRGLRKCKKCEQILPLEKFYKSPSKNWYDSYCLECKHKKDKDYRTSDPDSYRAKLRERYHSNRGHYRDLMRRSIYGVPLGTFDLLYEMQNGRCAICGADQSARDGRALSIDHSSENNIIRGLLCTACNQGIGQFRHNVSLLYAAIEYLLKSGYTTDELETLVKDQNEEQMKRVDFSDL